MITKFLDKAENIRSLVEELNIGHFIVGQAIYVGMEYAVIEMIRSIKRGRG